MPIYEYRCSRCGHTLEALQKLADAPLSECPACHEAALVKQVSAAGFQLKGSGWYVTDFRGKSAKGADAGDKAKTDAKPDAKPDTSSDSSAKSETSDSKGATKSTESSTTASPAPRASDASG